MRNLLGLLCVCALGVVPVVGCGETADPCSWMSHPEGGSGAEQFWLYGVSFTDANTGTAVGGAGTILRTTDGGRPGHRRRAAPRTPSWACRLPMRIPGRPWAAAGPSCGRRPGGRRG